MRSRHSREAPPVGFQNGAIMRLIAYVCALLAIACAGQAHAAPDAALGKAVSGSWRTQSLIARDAARHPAEELAFFGIKPDMTVVEIWPSGGYWTEMLGPYLHDHGTYYAATVPRTASARAAKAVDTFQAKLDANKAIYGNVKLSEFGQGLSNIAPDGSADLIVTFRNLHNWVGDGWAYQALVTFYKALKPGGILGIEDHRGSDAKPQDPKAGSGYLRQDYAIALAKKAGFELVGSSEIDANPKDTKDYPEGVWTLPPDLTLGDKDRAKYIAIGEADNFVLKFRKPLK
jgi:predicted methyltransferase